MTLGLLFRVILMFVFAAVAWTSGELLEGMVVGFTRSYTYGLTAVAAVIGFLLAPPLLTRPFLTMRKSIRQLPARRLLVGVTGLILGLIVSALLFLPLSNLPGVVGRIAPTVAAILLGVLGMTSMAVRERDILAVFGLGRSEGGVAASIGAILLDTSVIIDGRISDICETGFVRGSLLVPQFVLRELQHIADSSDPLRRNRGRRGLDVLERLQRQVGVPVEITDLDVPSILEVDSKLVQLARDLGHSILTNDYNLNRVAELQGVQVLNVHELASAVRTVLLPGESVRVHVIQEGKESGQGVAYLDDGTMVVVENGKRHIHSTVSVIVTRVLQTSAGRMVFAQLDAQGRS